MAVQLTTYGGILGGVLSWMGRAVTGETIISSRFDDILLLCERRMYYGYATEDAGNPLRSDPLRIPEMEVVDTAFSLTGEPDLDSMRVTDGDVVRVTEDAVDDPDVAATVGQPANFLELISATTNDPVAPLKIVAQRVIDAYGSQSLGGTKLIAVSGTNFRFLDEPSSGTCTLRYYQKLDTPAGSTTNDILDRYPDLYLFGCLIEASIMTQDEVGAQRYLQVYNASVSGLNARTQRITASTVPQIRLRVGMTP